MGRFGIVNFGSMRDDSESNDVSLYCEPNIQVETPCEDEIAGAILAFRIKTCDSLGGEYVFSESCDLLSCDTDLLVSDNLCISIVENPEPICESGFADTISCVEDVNFASIATRSRVCNEDEQSYTVSNVCTIEECINSERYDLVGNECVAKPIDSSAVDIGSNWMFFGDSETGGRASDATVKSQEIAFTHFWTHTYST